MSVEIKNKYVKKAKEIVCWAEVFNKQLAKMFDDLDQIRFEYRTTYEKVRKRLGNQVTFDQRYSVMKQILCEETRFKVNADVLHDLNSLIHEVLSGSANSNDSDAESSDMSLVSSEHQRVDVEYDQSRLKELFQAGISNKEAIYSDDGASVIILSSDSQDKKYASSLSRSDSSGQDQQSSNNIDCSEHKFDDKKNIQKQIGSTVKPTLYNTSPSEENNSTKRRYDLFADNEEDREKNNMESKENKQYSTLISTKSEINDKRESLPEIEKPKSSGTPSQSGIRLSVECLNNNRTSDISPHSLTIRPNPSISEKIIETFKKFKEY